MDSPFEPDAEATEVALTHELLPSKERQKRHLEGWIGCLDALESLFG